MSEPSFQGLLIKAASMKDPATFFTGTVTAVSGRVLTVSIEGSTGTVAVKMVGQPIPVMGSAVLVLRTNVGALYALGEI